MNFYKTKRWQRIRERVLRRDHYECRQCKRLGIATEATTVHHIFPIEDFPEYRAHSWNLISLCRRCHEGMHERFTRKLSDVGIEWMERSSNVVSEKR